MSNIQEVIKSMPTAIRLVIELFEDGYSIDDIALRLFERTPVIDEDKIAEDQYFDERGRYVPPPQILARAIYEGFPPRALPQAFLEFNLSGKRELYAHKAFLQFVERSREEMSEAFDHEFANNKH